MSLLFARGMNSGHSLDELDDAVANSSTRMSFTTELFEQRMRAQERGTPPPSTSAGTDEEDWNILNKKIDSCVRLDTQFVEYPKQELFQSPPGSGNLDDEQTGIKVFLGGMRFEVVQLGRHMISWLLETACGVRLPEGRILIHRKSRNGKPAAPTGCASVYVAEEADVQRLIKMNQRIFCSEKGIHVAPSAEKMAELIQSRTILDIVDGRVRGPTHPIIIERAYNNNLSHTPITCSTPGATTPPASSLQNSFSQPPPAVDPLVPVYHRYEGDGKAKIDVESQAVENPIDLFVGGLCYEATRSFVSWMFQLIGVKVHPLNVTMYIDAQTGIKRGCAQVKVEEPDFAKASLYTRRMLCDAFGVYIAESPQGITALQANRDQAAGHRGPTHAVVIERRRNTSRPTAAVSQQMLHQLPSMPPPQYSFNVVPGTSLPMGFHAPPMPFVPLMPPPIQPCDVSTRPQGPPPPSYRQATAPSSSK